MLNYSSPINETKSFSNLELKEISPVMKLIIPMENKQINVTVTDPVFLDKENKRLNA